MALIRWLLLALMAFAFVLLAVSNWTLVDFILPDGSLRAVPLPLLLGLAFLAGVIPTWVWMAIRPLGSRRNPAPRAARTERVESVPAADPAPTRA
jgi:uncharacterized integral membrane protein